MATFSRWRRAAAYAGAVAALGGGPAACGGGRPLQGLPPDVLLIVVDTLRHDELAWGGADPAYAPTLTRLAREGIVFPRAYAPCSWTKTSTASILTGLDPWRHGVLGHYDRLDQSVETVAESLSAGGWETVAVMANPSLYDTGTRQGFGSFRTVGRTNQWLDHSSAEAGQAARKAIRGASRKKPLFLYVHFLDPHDRYVPPDEDRLFLPAGPLPAERHVAQGNMRHFEGDTPVREPTAANFVPRPIPLPPASLAYLRGLYRGELHAVDRQIGAILEEHARRRGNALLTIVTSDHGEAFFEHGMYRHGWTLHEEVIRVPLLFHGAPASRLAGRSDRIARSVDIVPTVLDLLGVSSRQAHDGASLAGPAAAEPAVLMGLTRYHVQKLCYLIKGPFKLILDERFGRHELYDLHSDPYEKDDLASRQPERVREMSAELQRRRSESVARRFTTGTIEGAEREQLEEAMKALGYVH